MSLPNISDPNLGSPMLTSYRDALLAHLPVYTDHVSPKEGVFPVASNRYKDVTIRRHRKGGRGKKFSNSHTEDSFVPLSVRLKDGTDSVHDVVSYNALLVSGALRDSPLDQVKG